MREWVRLEYIKSLRHINGATDEEIEQVLEETGWNLSEAEKKLKNN